MKPDLLDRFIKLLTRITSEVWESTVAEGAGWKWMKPFSNNWSFGHFATFFIMLGLNNYQLKGKAEIYYWPKVVPIISVNYKLKMPEELIVILQPFYRQERFSDIKVVRLNRFLKSQICNEIWINDALYTSENFQRIWYEVSYTMKQKPKAKTIAFAMKCLAQALLMVDVTKFDFETIPVPVDSRIQNLSKRLGLQNDCGDAEREIWRNVLNIIRKSNPKITMVHLDSLLWQIGTLPIQQMYAHLMTVGVESNLAKQITECFNS